MKLSFTKQMSLFLFSIVILNITILNNIPIIQGIKSTSKFNTETNTDTK